MNTGRKKIEGLNDLHLLREVWSEKKDSEKSFTVDIKQIEDNDYDISLPKYKKFLFKSKEFDDPSVIIDRVLEKEGEISKELSKLRKELK